MHRALQYVSSHRNIINWSYITKPQLHNDELQNKFEKMVTYRNIRNLIQH